MSTSVPALYGLFLVTGGIKNVEAAFSYRNFNDAWTKPPVWDYDAAFYNFGVHPYMGGMWYLASRNRHGGIIESFAISAFGTFSFEYIIESFSQQPSINDLITTPLLGAALGEASYQLIKKMKSDHHLNLPEKICITFLDPVEVLSRGFRYKKLATDCKAVPKIE